MAGPPFVSVITPTRNRPDLLGATLDSVASQTLADWEHIVVVDGPDDAATAVLAQRSAADPRVSYIASEGPGGGANVCRNIGLRRAKADLLLFLDDDDQLAPDCLAGRIALMQRNPELDFAVFGAEIFSAVPGDVGRRYHDLEAADDLLRFLSLDCPWQTSGPIWRRAYLERLGGFCERLASLQDLELHVRALCRRPRYLIVRAPDHYIRGQVDAARTSTRHFHDPDVIRRSESVPALLLQEVERAGLLSWSRKRAALGLAFATAESWARIGRLGEALRFWRETGAAWCAPVAVRLGGVAALLLTRLAPGDGGWTGRLINRWKGRVRFRQEPAVTPEATAAGSGAS